MRCAPAAAGFGFIMLALLPWLASADDFRPVEQASGGWDQFASVCFGMPLDLPTVLLGPVSYGGHDYYLLSNSNWTNAEAAAVGLGGHLATIGSAAENDFVTSTFGAYFSFRNWRLWIGLTDHAHEGTFVWASGEPITYTKWASGEPNQSGDEDWVHIYGTDVPSYAALKWNDIEDVPNPDYGTAYGVVEVDVSAGILADDASTQSGAARLLRLAGANPSTGTVAISLVVPAGGRVTLAVYDVRGSRIKSLVERYMPEGNHTIDWNCNSESGCRVPPGVYFLCLRSPAGETSRPVVVVQ